MAATSELLFELLSGDRDFGDDETTEIRARAGALVLAEVVDIARFWATLTKAQTETEGD